MWRAWLLAFTVLAGCSSTGAVDGGLDAGARDAGASIDAAASPRDARVALPDATPSDGAPTADGATTDATTPLDAAALDAGAPDPLLAALRDALFATYASDACAGWAALDVSQRAVFLTITHRLHTSRTPDGRSMLEHIDGLHLVLGGGASGTTCGGSENNRLFLSMDAYLHARMVETWDEVEVIDDGGGGHWIHTEDAAGPHDPFDASDETETGLDCLLLFERSGSRPPTAQAHFFLDGSAERVERGAGISLAVDAHMLEIDLDFDCIHDSNPTCGDHEERYRTNHGDFACEWVPSACTPVGAGCYRSAS